MLNALDSDEHLVEVPLVPWPWSAAAYAICKALAEFPAPSPHCLIGDGNSPLGQIPVEALQALLEKDGAYLGRDVE